MDFVQPHPERIAQPGDGPAPAVGQPNPVRIDTKGPGPDGRERHQRAGAGLVQPDEQAGAGDPGDRRREFPAHPVGQEDRAQPVRRVAFGGGGAPLGAGYVGGRRFRPLLSAAVGPALAETARGDQGTVHHEVRVTPDRRGEVGVSPESQSEMADIRGAVDRLGLRPEDRLAHQLRLRRSGDPLQQAREVAGPQRAAAGEAQLQKVPSISRRASTFFGSGLS